MLRILRLSLAIALTVSAAFFATILSAPQNSNTPLPGSASRSQFVPYYSVTQGFAATLMLNNATRAAFVVKPTVYSLDGMGVPMEQIPLNAHETRTIDLGQWVTRLGDEYATGSLRLDYESVGYGLGAMVMMVNEQESLALDVLGRPPLAMKSSHLESIWWAPDPKMARIRFAVQNTTEAQVTGALSLSSAEGNEIKSVILRLEPYQTRVFNLHELVDREKAALGGISIRHDGRPGALLAQGFVIQADIGFSANLEFEDPATFGGPKLEGAGVLVGREGATSAAQAFSGHLLLRNVSADPIRVTPTLQRGSFQLPLAPIQLLPKEVREILIAANSLPDRPEATGIEIKHTGAPGSLVGYWFSVDASASLVVETPLRSPAPNERAAGNNPWTIEGDSSSVLYVKNTGNQAAHFVGSIWHEAGQYTIGLKEVAAGETIAIDLRQLRDQRVPDATGRMLPPDVLAGQVLWYWHDGPPLIGRVNTMSVSKAIASNMSCPACCWCPTTRQVSLDPSTFVGPVGASMQHAAWETDFTPCGTTKFAVSPSWLSWSSSNSVVAWANASGGAGCLSPGRATIWADPGVNIPFSSVLSAIQAPYECPACDAVPADSGSDDMTVTPRIDSISPSRGPIGLTVTVTISGSGFGTSPTVNAGTGITASVSSASDTSISASFSVASSAASGNHSVTVTNTTVGQTSNSVNFFVQVPTSLSIVPGTDSTTAEATCSAGSFGTGCGVTRSFIYQVNDQAGPPIQAAGLQVWDAINTTSPNVLGITGYITTCTGTPVGTNSGPCNVTTNSLGQFGENNPGLSVCSTVCRVNNACTTGGPTNASQTVHVGSSTITQSLSYYCDHVTVNGQ